MRFRPLLALIGLTLGGACGSPTEPTARILAQLVDPESGVVLVHGENPHVSVDEFGTITVYTLTDGGCPVEYPDVEVLRNGTHAIVLLYEVRRTVCREFWTPDRVRISHMFEHIVRLAAEDGLVETLEVVAREPDGRLHRTVFPN